MCIARSIELNVEFLCTCLPVLPPLSQKLPSSKYSSERRHSWTSVMSRDGSKSRRLSVSEAAELSDESMSQKGYPASHRS